jgi:hypothetical protein
VQTSNPSSAEKTRKRRDRRKAAKARGDGEEDGEAEGAEEADAKAAPEPAPAPQSAETEDPAKKLRNLNKKLKQIGTPPNHHLQMPECEPGVRALTLLPPVTCRATQDQGELD